MDLHEQIFFNVCCLNLKALKVFQFTVWGRWRSDETCGDSLVGYSEG
jgi:hypothetical protein